jgi:hypothetical protein
MAAEEEALANFREVGVTPTPPRFGVPRLRPRARPGASSSFAPWLSVRRRVGRDPFDGRPRSRRPLPLAPLTCALHPRACSLPLTTVRNARSLPLIIVRNARSLPLITVRNARSLPLTTVRNARSLPLITVRNARSLPLTTVRNARSLPVTTPQKAVQLLKATDGVVRTFQRTKLWRDAPTQFKGAPL